MAAKSALLDALPRKLRNWLLYGDGLLYSAEIGRWDVNFGFFKGFGFGMTWMPGEVDATFGCLGFSAATYR